MRCWCFTPDNRFSFSIVAPWFSLKRPRNWGMPANDNWRDRFTDIELDFTPTGGKR